MISTDSIYKRLLSLKMGDEIQYNPNKGTLQDWNVFIEATKRYISDHHIHPDHTILIRSDWMAVKKIKPFEFPNKNEGIRILTTETTAAAQVHPRGNGAGWNNRGAQD